MTIYRISDNKHELNEIPRTTFEELGMLERQDIQQLLKKDDAINAIAPKTLIVAEEFNFWESNRRIDLLGIDKNANLVVIELKRTEDGGHMDLQAIRYAAMISTLTFAELVPIFTDYLERNGIDQDPEGLLLGHLGWEEPNEKEFGKKVKIILASADFNDEITTAIMWLNDFGLDIQCVRMQPYKSEGQTLLDIQRVIPLPEVEQYQVRIREKKQTQRTTGKRNPRYDVIIADEMFTSLTKRAMMYTLIRTVIKKGHTLQAVINAVPQMGKRLFKVLDGHLTAEQVVAKINEEDPGGKYPLRNRYFCNSEELFRDESKTYVLTNQWGGDVAINATNSLKEAFPDLNIEVKESPSEGTFE